MIEVYNASCAPEFSVPMSKVLWPTSVTAKEKSSRQKKKFRGKKEIGHGKRKKLPAKEKCSRQKKLVTAKAKSSPEKKNFRGKRKTLATKINWLQQKKKARGKRKMLAAKKKLVTLIASAKIPEREGSISSSSFYG